MCCFYMWLRQGRKVRQGRRFFSSLILYEVFLRSSEAAEQAVFPAFASLYGVFFSLIKFVLQRQYGRFGGKGEAIGNHATSFFYLVFGLDY